LANKTYTGTKKEERKKTFFDATDPLYKKEAV
jgi:hypothetical protein